MSILRAERLSKRYRGRQVVDQVSVAVESGEVVGLLGPNGAGKTTCFYMIAGLIRPDQGQIYLDERSITRLPMHQRARMGLGYLPQEPSIFRKLSVVDNLLAVLELRGGLSRSERRARAEMLLDELNVAHLHDQTALSLSGGERRRVEIARALACEPKFMLLDEPFAGVDPISIADLQAIIRGLTARRIGVLITDHNVRETLGICQRAYILSEGAVIAGGSPDAILADSLVRQVYLGDRFRL